MTEGVLNWRIDMEKMIRLGISTCLLGEKVRYDGGHKLNRFLTDTLGKYVQYVPVCPEVECGLSVPREPMHLVGDPRAPRLVTFFTKQDHTERMVQWAHRRIIELKKEDLSGFIFKSNSPSSGMERVRIYNGKGIAKKKGVGIFAQIFMECFPLLPVEDESRLHKPKIRENFIERIFTLKRWREIPEKKSCETLVDFHTKHKLLILSHSPSHYYRMEKLVAGAKDISKDELFQQYQALLTEALKMRTTLKKNSKVLQQLLGYFKKKLLTDEKKELVEAIDSYGQGNVPLIVPLTLMNHHARKYGLSNLKDQYYLHPHPLELQMRNHA